MKQIIAVLLIMLPLLSCSELTESTLTITNNCTASVDVNYTYYDDDGYYYNETVTVDVNESRDETIYDKNAYVSVYATKGLDNATYHYYGGDHEIIMVDGDF